MRLLDLHLAAVDLILLKELSIGNHILFITVSKWTDDSSYLGHLGIAVNLIFVHWSHLAMPSNSLI